MNPMERVKALGDLSRATAGLKAADTAIAKIKAAAEVRRILALFDVAAPAEASPSGDLAVSMADPEASVEALMGYAASGYGGLPKPLVAAETRAIVRMQRGIGIANRNLGILPPGLHGDEEVTALYDYMAARSVEPPVDAEDIRSEMARHEYIREEARQKSKEIWDKCREQIDDVRIKADLALADVDAKLNAARQRGDEQEIRILESMYDAIVDAGNEKISEIRSKANEESEPLQLIILGNNNEHMEDAGGKIISAVMEKSPISEEEAKAWADEQVIEPSAVAKLKRNGYPVEDLRKDCADFYRMTGGKLPSIIFETTRSGRAHASGIENVQGSRRVAISSNFGRGVLFHELGHHLEGDPVAKEAANGYLVRRRESAKLYRLRDLTKNPNYRPSEVAYKDKFLNPYMGKVYSDRCTEVFSMGMEYLAHPKKAATLFAKDRELYDLITGYIAHAMTPAAKALSRLGVESRERAKSAAEEQAQKDKELQAAFDAEVKRFAAKVSLVQTLSGEAFGAMKAAALVAMRWKDGLVPKYEGSYGDRHVFSGKFYNGYTGRYVKGIFIAERRDNGLAGGEMLPTDLTTAKAVLAVTEVMGEVFVWNTWKAFFREQGGSFDSRRDFIEWAKDRK